MSISPQIRCFVRFALVTLLGFGGIWLCMQLRISLYITLWLLLAAGLVVLVGVLGMVWSLVEWLISGIVAWFRSETCRRKGLSHEESSA